MVRLPDPLLRDFGADELQLACRRCNRYGRYKVTALLRRFPFDLSFPEAVAAIADCQRAKGYMDPCQVEVVRAAPAWWAPAPDTPIGRVRLTED